MGTARGRRSGLGLGIASSIVFGTSGPFGKALIGAGYSPLQASWTRVAGATLILLPLVVALRGRTAARAARRWWPILLLYWLAGVAILLEFTGPVLVVLWTRFMRRTPVPRAAAIGVGVALAGLACVVQVWSGLALDPLGLLAGLGAAACQAAYFLIVDRVGGQVDPLVLTAAGSAVGAVALSLVAPPWRIPWHLAGQSVAFGARSAPGWVLISWLIVVSTVIAYLTGVAAVQRLSAPVAGAVAYVETVSAGLFAWVVLGERLSLIQVTGGLVVLVGAFIAQRSVPPARAQADQVLIAG